MSDKCTILLYDIRRKKKCGYYILKVRVTDVHFDGDELEVAEAVRQNGNDTFSAGSPKVLYY